MTWFDPPAGALNRHEGVPATARIATADTHAVELRAFAAHRSQLDFLESFRRDCLTTTEDFALVAGTPQPAAIVGDLFAGLA